MEELPRKREHVEIFFDSHASLEDGQHLPQEPPKEADSNSNTFGFHSAHGQVKNPAPCKLETRAAKKTRYEAYQVRWQGRIRVSLVFNRAGSRQEAGNLSP